jgi:SPP1 family predicted phage head-tail adaptor
MRSGRLDRAIELQSATLQDDGAGNQTETWTTYATMRAQLIEGSTEEFIRNWGASSEPAFVFRTRWLDGVTLAHRVIYDGTIHPIKELKEIGRRRGLEIRTAGYGESL